MNSHTSAERVTRQDARRRPAPCADWGPDTRAPSFSAECRRQCQAVAAANRTEAGCAEAEFWERVSADAWDHLD